MYLLLGIFDVYMPLIYGEGKDSAFNRLWEGVDKASKGKSLLTFSTKNRYIHDLGSY